MKIYTIIILTMISSFSIAKDIQYSSVTPKESRINHQKTENIKWSGYVLESIKKDKSACLMILETKVDGNNRPLRTKPQNNSRFLACLGSNTDVSKFDNKLVTISGDIAAFTDYKNNKENYVFPIVATHKIHVWNEGVVRPLSPYNYSRQQTYHYPAKNHRRVDPPANPDDG